MLDPVEYRRRAQACREKAEKAAVARQDMLDAAATWEHLAQQAEFLLSLKHSADKQDED